MPGGQGRDHRVAVARPDRVRERVDPRAVAIDVLEDDDAVSPGPHDVAEHRPGLDRRQLAGIADEHQPCLRPHRLDQPRHQRERDHRRLVDDHDVVRQPVAAVVPEAAVAVGPPAQQPVQRRRLEREQLGADLGRHGERRRRGVHRLLQPRLRLARRRGERHERRGITGRGGLLGQQRDDPRHRRRLARARPAGDDREAVTHGGCRGRALLAVLGTEQAVEAVAQHRLVDRDRTAEGEQIGSDLALLAPVAIEVERAADEPQRAALRERLPHRNQRARLEAEPPTLNLRPR